MQFDKKQFLQQQLDQAELQLARLEETYPIQREILWRTIELLKTQLSDAVPAAAKAGSVTAAAKPGK